MISKDNSTNPEYVKAGYIYSLTNYIYWPKNSFNFSVSPFIIGLYGNQNIKTAIISSFRDKKIQNREWKVEFYNSPESIRHCHLIYTSGITISDAKKLISYLSDRQVLLIAENLKDFCQIGGMINLVGISPNYGFQVNLKALNNARLNIMPEFLELASVIE